MTRRVYRYEVPVDDDKHLFPLTSGPLHVEASGRRLVEFWAEHEDNKPAYTRAFQVFGTGQPLPDEAAWVGTCDRVGDFIWHLYEVSP